MVLKKDLNTTVHTINSSTPKFSKVLDTEFIADDNTGISMSNLEFINTLYEVEKTAIGNTKLLRDEMNLMVNSILILISLMLKLKVKLLDLVEI